MSNLFDESPAAGGAGRRQAIRWVDKTEDGDPRPTTTNAGLAIGYLGIRCAKDAFHEKLTVGGQVIDQWAGALTDEVVLMLRKAIKRAYDFDPGDNNCRAAAVQLCLENQFNPVVDYLDGLKWDGVERVKRLAADYFGAADTPLNSEIGRLMLVAAVRRARAPGTKFDQIIVLEGREGTMKSTAIKILAGDDNFSDQNVLAASDKEQQEALTGVWLHEIAELAGMRRAEVERIKQFASRTEDRARPAFGRLRVDHKRTSVLIATTNEKTYLQSDTGNRRFWPIETGHIQADSLIRDRDQLWAEATAIEATGCSLVLDPKLWGDASDEQEKRRISDPWETAVTNFVESLADTSITEILIGEKFQMKLADIGQTEQNRVARVLHRLGFTRYQKRNGEKREWRYSKTLVTGGETVTKNV
jgi:predicted P-loop ATPase